MPDVGPKRLRSERPCSEEAEGVPWLAVLPKASAIKELDEGSCNEELVWLKEGTEPKELLGGVSWLTLVVRCRCSARVGGFPPLDFQRVSDIGRNFEKIL